MEEWTEIRQQKTLIIDSKSGRKFGQVLKLWSGHAWDKDTDWNEDICALTMTAPIDFKLRILHLNVTRRDYRVREPPSTAASVGEASGSGHEKPEGAGGMTPHQGRTSNICRRFSPRIGCRRLERTLWIWGNRSIEKIKDLWKGAEDAELLSKQEAQDTRDIRQSFIEWATRVPALLPQIDARIWAWVWTRLP